MKLRVKVLGAILLAALIMGSFATSVRCCVGSRFRQATDFDHACKRINTMIFGSLLHSPRWTEAIKKKHSLPCGRYIHAMDQKGQRGQAQTILPSLLLSDFTSIPFFFFHPPRDIRIKSSKCLLHEPESSSSISARTCPFLLRHPFKSFSSASVRSAKPP